MKKLTPKMKLIQKIDPRYLREVTLLFHNSPRYDFLSKSDEELIDYYASKYDRKQVVKLLQSFILSKSTTEIALQLKEKSGKELTRLFIQSLPKRYEPKIEFRVGNRLCDLVYLDDDGYINAIEVKANGDKLDSASKQIENYSRWSNKVWLLIEKKKISEINKKILPPYAGVIIYQNDVFEIIKPAEKIEHDFKVYLELLSLKGLKDLAGRLRVRKSGTKQEISANLMGKMDQINFLPRKIDFPRLLKEIFISS